MTIVAQLESGRAWPLISPAADHVYWPDIAAGLAKICRFNGHSTAFYSVAQHCCLVADTLAPPLRLYGLLHDAHEAILGDITTPTRLALCALGDDTPLRQLIAVTDHAIHAAAGLAFPLPEATQNTVRHADLTVLATERRDVMAASSCQWRALTTPEGHAITALPRPITPWPWATAATQWLNRLEALTGRNSRTGKPLPPNKATQSKPHQNKAALP